MGSRRPSDGQLDIPVLADVDCGHTDPMITIPFGLTATVDTERPSLRIAKIATNDPDLGR